MGVVVQSPPPPRGMRVQLADVTLILKHVPLCVVCFFDAATELAPSLHFATQGVVYSHGYKGGVSYWNWRRWTKAFMLIFFVLCLPSFVLSVLSILFLWLYLSLSFSIPSSLCTHWPCIQ